MTNPDNIAFYDVPFACSVKPVLGFGAAAEPVLLDLANNEEVEAAWMNHQGTLIALIWKENTSKIKKQEILKFAFKAWDMIPDLIDDEQKEKLVLSFKSDEGWHKEGEVDQLSFEEAGEYADPENVKTLVIWNKR